MELDSFHQLLERARARLFPPTKWAGLFPSAAYRRSAPPQLAQGILKRRCLGCCLEAIAAQRNKIADICERPHIIRRALDLVRLKDNVARRIVKLLICYDQAVILIVFHGHAEIFYILFLCFFSHLFVLAKHSKFRIRGMVRSAFCCPCPPNKRQNCLARSILLSAARSIALDGTAFVFKNKKDAEPTTGGGRPTAEAAAVYTPISSTSETSISDSGEKFNEKLSTKEDGGFETEENNSLTKERDWQHEIYIDMGIII